MGSKKFLKYKSMIEQANTFSALDEILDLIDAEMVEKAITLDEWRELNFETEWRRDDLVGALLLGIKMEDLKKC